MDYRDRILKLIKYKPQLPSAIAKGLGVNTIIAGAMLSEMVSKRILRISNLKIGSSPLYFLPENEPMLEDFKDNLDGKSLQAYEILKEQGVVREADQTPLVRVCLKQIRDYAKPLEVQYDGQSEVFYKWFLLSDDDAKKMISKILNPDELVVEKHESPVDQALREKVEQQKEEDSSATRSQSSDTTSTSQTSAKESKPEVATTTSSSQNTSDNTKNKADSAKTKTASTTGTTAASSNTKTTLQKEKSKPDKAQSSSKSQSAPSSTPSTSSTKQVTNPSDEQQWLTATHLSDDPLVDDVAKYCKVNKIGILWHEVKRKGSEAHFELTVPSPVGRLTFFALAKSKKKVNESDLSSAYVAGQLKKLPTIFLAKGELSKKGTELLKDLKSLTFTQM